MLVELSDLFDDCVRRRVAAGTSRAEAERLCDKPSWPTHRPPYSSEAAGGPSKAGLAVGGLGVEDLRKRRSEALVRPPKRGGVGLGSPVAPLGPDTRTEAHVWAREKVRTGHRPPFDKPDWEETARRRGMGPDEIAAGWRYIVDVFSKKLEQTRDHVVAAIERGLGEYFDRRIGGYSIVMPQATRAADEPPVYPFQSQAAKTVYTAARKIAAKDSGSSIKSVYDRALKATGVGKLSKGDKAMMDLAISWELSGKDPQPEPPPVGKQRSYAGMKGTGKVSRDSLGRPP